MMIMTIGVIITSRRFALLNGDVAAAATCLTASYAGSEPQILLQ
jgi:hypothetical protein